MAWVDYGYYTGAYLGSAVGETEFPALEERSAAFVDYVTGGMAGERKELDCVKKAVCAVADEWQRQARGGAVTQERVGDWQRTFASPPSRSVHRALWSAARPYLAPAGLMRTVDWA